MSYEKVSPVMPSKGVAFQSFRADQPSWYGGHQQYTPDAAGPRFLTTDGLGAYVNRQRSHVQWDLRGGGLGASFVDLPHGGTPWNLRGMGQVTIPGLTDVVAQVEAQIDKVVTGIINRNWPVFEAKLDDALKPVKILLVAGTACAGAAAILSALSYLKK